MIIEERTVGPVKLILKRYDCRLLGEGADEYRIFVNAAKTGNPLQFHGPYYKLSVAKGQMTRISKDPRFHGWKKVS